MNFDFAINIIPLIITIVIGIAAYFLSMFLLRKLFKKFLTADEYARFKRNRINIVIPLLIGLVIIYVQYTILINNTGENYQPILESLTLWLSQHGVAIALVAIIAFILNKLLSIIIPPAIHNFTSIRSDKDSSQAEINKRSDMLSNFLVHIGQAIIILIAIFIILSELEIDIGPMLAGAGVVGLAVGLGAQRFIGDLINGICIVIEDYYSVGDVVKVAGISGLVEEVNIRRTVLRDLDGIVHIIPNSEVKIASNLTRNWSRVNINIRVSYNEDIDKVISVLNRVGLQLAQDEKFKDLIITAPQVLRVDNFADSAVEIKMLGDTKPMKQWDVTGELRKRVKKAFDEEHIEIPWPHVKVYSGDKNTSILRPQLRETAKRY